VTETEDSPSPVSSWDDLRTDFINRVLAGFSALALLGIPISVSRALETGLQPSMLFHLILGVLLVIVYLFRNQVNIHTKASILILGSVGVAILGLFNWGIFGNGLMWFLMAAFLMACMYPLGHALVFMGLMILTSITAAWLFLSGIYHFPIDANRYFLNPSAWGSAIIGSIGFVAIVLYGLSILHRSFRELLDKVEQQRRQIIHLANHDSLTGLPSLRLAEDRFAMALQRANREQHQVGVFFMDLDDFKPINDQFGHSTGDQVLKIIAGRLAGITREVDTIARIGGDEFLMIAPVIGPSADLKLIAQRVVDTVKQPVELNNQRFELGISIGIAIYPDDGNTPSELTNKADAAMYQAKRSADQLATFVGQND
jgi:diguanylate cyclase (GGDEF)-like protein